MESYRPRHVRKWARERKQVYPEEVSIMPGFSARPPRPRRGALSKLPEMSIKEGQQVKVVNQKSLHYGKIGSVQRPGSTGGWWVELENGTEPVYIPFGLERVSPEELPPPPAAEEV